MTVPAVFAARLRDGSPRDERRLGREADAAAAEDMWESAPDPDTDPPDDAGLAGIPGELAFALFEAEAAAAPAPAARFVPGGWSRPGRTAGAGFAAGGAADATPPGVVLAGLTARAWDSSARVSDDELVGIARAFGRLAAWVTAGQLAAVAELAARREAQVTAGADRHIAEHVTDEVAAALTLTSRAADNLVNFASALRDLPATRTALWRGEIDQARARVMAEAVTGLDPRHAATVEAAVIGAAARQTTGQLRAAARRAVLSADPSAADRRRQEAQKDARVETWSEAAGTAALAGRDLPPAEVLAADRHIDALARQLKDAGAGLPMDALRARVYTALLLGIPVQDLHSQLAPAAGPDGRAGSRTGQHGAGGGAGREGGETGLPLPPVTGTLNLTMPLATWLGGAAPGEIPGFGPVPAGDARALARLLAATPGTGICLTLTGPDGTAVAHGCARPGAASRPGDGLASLTVTIEPLACEMCGHRHETAAYRPSARLRHMIIVRQRTCSFPGCRRNAARCDLDHTVPFGQGGRTCECNLAPLCRRHHRAKQAGGWSLVQTSPGHVTWTLPHGRTYRAGPDPYPRDPPHTTGPARTGGRAVESCGGTDR